MGTHKRPLELLGLCFLMYLLDKLAKAGGAVPGSTAHFSSWTPNHVALRVTVPNEDDPNTSLFSAVRGFHKVGPDIILEHVVQTARGPYRGQGYERFHEQLKHLRDLGIKGIHIESGVGTGGPEGSIDGYTGYPVWPSYAAMETAFHKAFVARKNMERRTAK